MNIANDPGPQPSTMVPPVPTRPKPTMDPRWIMVVGLFLVVVGLTATFYFGRWTERHETAPSPPPPADAVPEAPGPDNTITTMPPPPPPETPSPPPDEDE